ncbi:MAG TPA: methionine ABC transporter ATP-binding protein [Symbiobacteriaceae bacterium]|nr:methionine ABC transporter ATP-binding protein [Symbiobacteriaceae bacterium]
MIQLQQIAKTYKTGARQVDALRDVTLHVKPGEIYGVLGQSGAGKSTLIRCVNLLERPTEGRVIVDGQDLLALPAAGLRQARQKIGMIFQHFNLLDSRTVGGNVAFPLEVAGWPKAKITARVTELLALVGLAERANSYPSQLSGGQKQRVGIARALAAGPKVLLSDEATSALDPETTRSVLALLKEINQKLGLTILLITHQMEVVKAVCDSVAILEDGRLVEQGAVVDLLADPATRLHQLCYPLMAEAPPSALTGQVGAGERAQTGALAQPSPTLASNWPSHPGAALLGLTYVGEPAEQPVISLVARRFKVDLNVIQGNVELVGQTRIGRLVVEATGDPDDLTNAIAFLEGLNVRVEHLAKGGDQR